MSWGNKAAADQPAGDPSSNVRLVQEYEDVRRVSTRRRTYDRTEGKVNQEEPDSDKDSGTVEPEPGSEPDPDPVLVPVPNPVLKLVSLPEVPEPVPDQGENRIPSGVLPDVTEEVLEHLVELRAKEGRSTPEKATVMVQPSLTSSARKEMHYNMMKDIEKRLAEVTIGQLLKDSPRYRMQVMDAVKIRRRRKLPATISDVRYTEVEDWGAPEIDTEIDGCMITRVPVDGGSGVNVMMEQTANDLGYTKFALKHT